MRKKSSPKKLAFSLIELSILMVILGLLVAGASAGAALIKNAEIRSTLAESQRFRSLVSAFYGNFSYAPGDYPQQLRPGALSGNGDGAIEYVGATNNAPFVNETYLAWQQLKDFTAANVDLVAASYAISNSGASNVMAMNSNPSTGAAGGAKIGIHIPSSKARGGAWVFDYVPVTAGPIATQILLNKNVLTIMNPVVPAVTGVIAGSATGYMASNVNGGVPAIATTPTENVGILTPTDAEKLDDKADDSFPSTGSIRALSNWATNSNNYSCISGATNTYETSLASARSQRNCAITFDLDI